MRSDTLAHSAHTRSGIKPRRINLAKIAQPRQNPSAASSVAAAAMAPTSSWAMPVAANPKWATVAATESVAPIAWAKRFGGPGTGRGAMRNAGTITLVASSASGLNVGPAATRATNP